MLFRILQPFERCYISATVAAEVTTRTGTRNEVAATSSGVAVVVSTTATATQAAHRAKIVATTMVAVAGVLSCLLFGPLCVKEHSNWLRLYYLCFQMLSGVVLQDKCMVMGIC